MFHRPKTETQEPVQKNDTARSETNSEAAKTADDADAEAREENVEQDVKPESEDSAAAASSNEENTPENETTDTEESNMSNDDQQAKSEAPAAQTASQGRPVDIPGTAPFQRGMQQAPASNYAGNYGSSQNADEDGRRMVIGQGITMSGEIEACDHVVVEGTLEAALKGARVLDIAETGTFYGTVEIEEATIAGRFEGDLTVNGRVTIASTGYVTGAISYKELAVEAGATLDGKITPLSQGAAQQSRPQQQQKKNVAPRNDNEGQSEGSELPFSGNSAAAAE